MAHKAAQQTSSTTFGGSTVAVRQQRWQDWYESSQTSPSATLGGRDPSQAPRQQL